jgi:hypothetical protein
LGILRPGILSAQCMINFVNEVNRVAVHHNHRHFMASQDRKTGVSTTAGWLIIGLLLIQFIPLDRLDHPSKPPANISATVLAVLEARCFSCHSGETKWPRSAYIAPLSWYVTEKVRQAREAVNFSNFDALPDADRHDIEQSVSRLAGTPNLSTHGRIPGFPRASMTEQERLVLARWALNNNREQKDTINNSAH